MVRFKRFSTKIILQKSTTGSACYDLYIARCTVLEPGNTRSIETDIGFCSSEKYVGQIYPHSSLSLKSIVLGGIIDSDYRGNVRLILHNFSNKRVEFNTDDRIAQILFEKKESPKFVEVSNFEDFVTERTNDLDQLEFKWLRITTYLNMYPVI